MDNWEKFVECPKQALWDIKIKSRGQEFVIDKVYFINGQVMSWYKNWSDFGKIYPNYEILEIKLHKGK
jgi:hypothetical protein